jgi:hypothetical protein
MNKYTIALLGALALVASPALSGCETDTNDPEGNGVANVDTAVVVPDDSVNMDTDPDMAVDGDSVEANLDEAGRDLGEAADSAGAAVTRGAQAVGEVIDENVDLGENAENQ